MQSDERSPYQTPGAEIGVTAGGTEDLMSAFLGPKNTPYYQNVFDRFSKGGGFVSWNWPAFFVTWFWLAYRKMWAWFFVYWLVWPIVLALLSMVLIQVSTALGYVTYIVGSYLVPPMFVNSLYYKHALKKIDQAQRSSGDPSGQALEAARLGGTSNIALIMIPFFLVFLIGILAAIAIPAYQDYTIRAQVSEGLNLSGGAKAAVSEYYQYNQSAPRDNLEAGLADAASISGMYVQSVAVNDGEITVTYGYNAHQILSGNELYLTPTENNGVLYWECSSASIAAKHLPAACR